MIPLVKHKRLAISLSSKKRFHQKHTSRASPLTSTKKKMENASFQEPLLNEENEKRNNDVDQKLPLTNHIMLELNSINSADRFTPK
mmetsp:Transcript_39577/g.45059  ORF Transcript_39577/g.45059 Transcript_39577/m.45059 type:complete len:86 (+) Transcript_39577:109-366(+)